MVRLRSSILAAYPVLQRLAAHCTANAPASAGLATVQLQFETLDGQIRVADAQPEPSGASADPRAVCAAAAMRGAVFPAAGSTAGSTFRMPFGIASAATR